MGKRAEATTPGGVHAQLQGGGLPTPGANQECTALRRVSEISALTTLPLRREHASRSPAAGRPSVQSPPQPLSNSAFRRAGLVLHCGIQNPLRSAAAAVWRHAATLRVKALRRSV